ncbi:MAG: hypothetical protein IE878_06575 [Epsilonproteobacteria bacterium]|nr:hypothetical protein [Campylobacterota bacterium]
MKNAGVEDEDFFDKQYSFSGTFHNKDAKIIEMYVGGVSIPFFPTFLRLHDGKVFFIQCEGKDVLLLDTIKEFIGHYLLKTSKLKEEAAFFRLTEFREVANG